MNYAGAIPPPRRRLLPPPSGEVIAVATQPVVSTDWTGRVFSVLSSAQETWDGWSDQTRNQAKGAAITIGLWLIPGGFWRFCIGGAAAWGATELAVQVLPKKNEESQALSIEGRTTAIATATIANGVLLWSGGLSTLALPAAIVGSYLIAAHERAPKNTAAQNLRAVQQYVQTLTQALPLPVQKALEHATPVAIAVTTASPLLITAGIGATAAGSLLPKQEITAPNQTPNLPSDPRRPLLDLSFKIAQFSADHPKPTETIQSTEKAEHHLNQLATYGSYWGALYLMHTWGLGLDNTHFQQYTQIAREAVMNNEPLWGALNRHIGKNLTFFQRIKIRFWYWIFHSSNVLRSSAQKLFEKMTTDFRTCFIPNQPINQEKEDQLNAKVDAFLTDATELFRKYKEANLQDANRPVDRIYGHRREMIAQWHGPLNNLSKSFSDTIIAHWIPKELPFFEHLKTIPVFGHFLYSLTSPIRWILGKISKKLIQDSLPNVIRSLITTGIQATNRRPFAIALTKAITGLLTGFLNDLSNKGPKTDSEIPDIPLPAIQAKLPAFVSLLIDTLDLLPENLIPEETPDQLKTRVDALLTKKTSSNTLLSKLEQWRRTEIEKGILKGGHKLFKYLGENPQAIEKLFCTIAKISNLPFQQSGQSLSNEVLENAQKELFHIGNQLFQKIVGDGIDEFLVGPPPEVVTNTLQTLFEEQEKACEQFKGIEEVAKTMVAKYLQSKPIGAELDEIALKLGDFQKMANQKKIDGVYPPIREEIYRAFGSVYQQANLLMDQVKRLRDTQIKLTANQQLLASVVKMKERLQPKLLQNNLTLFPYFRASLGDMEKIIVSSPIIQNLRTQFDSAEQLVIALKKQQDLIVQIRQLDTEITQDIPRNEFNAINKTLGSLPEPMRKTLAHLIGEVQRARDPEKRGACWEAAKQGLQTAFSNSEREYQGQYAAFLGHMQPIQTVLHQLIEEYTENDTLHSKDLFNQLDTFGIEPLVKHVASIHRPDTVQRLWFQKLCRDYHRLQNLANDLAKEKSGLMEYTMDKFKRAYNLVSMDHIWEGFARTAMHLVINAYQ